MPFNTLHSTVCHIWFHSHTVVTWFNFPLSICLIYIFVMINLNYTHWNTCKKSFFGGVRKSFWYIIVELWLKCINTVWFWVIETWVNSYIRVIVTFNVFFFFLDFSTGGFKTTYDFTLGPIFFSELFYTTNGKNDKHFSLIIR